MPGQLFHDTPGLPRPDIDDGFDYIVGDRVYVDGDKPGAVAYVGEVKFAVGDWAGVVLEDPLGKHNGTVNGTEYFQCEPMHGLFVRMHRLTRYPTKTSSSTATTTATTSRGVHYNPTPITEPQSGRSSSASSTQRRSALKSPSRLAATSRIMDNDDDMNPSNWYKRQDAIDDQYESPYHQPRSLSRDSNRSTSSLGRIYNTTSPDSAQSKSTTILHKISSSRTPTPVSPAPLRRQSSALANRLSSRQNSSLNRNNSSNDTQHLLTPKTKFVADAYVPTYRRAPTPDSPLRLGTRVVVNSNQGLLTGILRYVGPTSFASGEWAGVELDESVGKNDGSMMGRRYFICPKNYGIFVPIFKVSKEYMPGSSRESVPLRSSYSHSSSREPTSRSHSSLSTEATKPKTTTKSTIRRPIFTSTCAPVTTTIETTTEPKTITTKTTTTRTRTIPIETSSPPLRRYKSSLSRLTYDDDDGHRTRDFGRNLDTDFDRDFDKDFEIARLAPLSPALDKYYSSSTKNSSSYSSRRLVDYSDMY